MKDLLSEADGSSASEAKAGFSELALLLAAIGCPLGKSRTLDLARMAGLRAGGGRPYNHDLMSAELQHALAQGELAHLEAGYVIAPAHAQAAFRQTVLSGRLAKWRKPIFTFLHVPESAHQWAHPRSEPEAVSVMRIALCTGTGGNAMEPVLAYVQSYDPSRLFFQGMCNPFDEEIFELVAPEQRDFYAERGMMWMLNLPNASAASLVSWAQQRSAEKNVLSSLRYRTCEHLLWQARFDDAVALIKDDASGTALALRAASSSMRRDHVRARELYTRALELLRAEERKRGGLLPITNGWLRAAALIVSGEPAALEEARRYARTEARALKQYGRYQWEQFEYAAAERLGERDPESQALNLNDMHGLQGLMRIEIAAWLKRRAGKAALAHVERCGAEFATAGYQWAARECEAAAIVLAGKKPEGELAGALAAAFAGEQTWRRVLAAITALSDAKRTEAEDTRLVWIINMHKGELVNIEPWEQKQGTRGGWNKGKRAPYALLMKTESLAPRDAQACRALERISSVSYEIDVDRVLPALIGHPLVFYDEDLGTPVELIAGEPEITVTRGKHGMRVVLYPDLRAVFARPDYSAYGYLRDGKKTERCLLVKETPARARVVRVTAAHKRIAELVGDSLEVPEDGAAELSQAIDSAARFFHVHSEVASAVPEIEADRSLRAELAPAGDGLRLRLVVQPFGGGGPRYAPGAGGARVIADVAGERRAALRDLDAERAAAARVLEALAMLDADNEEFEWVTGEPEDCLALVEALQTMQGAGEAVRIEWPSGAKFKVSRAYGAADLKLNVSSGVDWFTAKGGLALDEGMVIDMARLIEFARDSRGRFVPLGEGGFVALTDDLRRRIDEMANLGEMSGGGLQVPALAAGVLEEIAEGAQWSADKAWSARLRKVREAQTLEAEPPSTFAAELRPYQADGFRWLARLAHWGAGACLADDMGLGKTVQALALLLRRAPDGAALVVAPTSVCAQWQEEARRFAPTLKVNLFGASERAKHVEEAGAFDVVVCTYTMMQQEIELFAAREWHTVVLDEAQAVKNFATKRAQAVFSLKAGFRVATTGTPVENRMDELWTLFRFLNPGLLGPRERFNERYAAPIERARDARARARLRRLVRPFILRRTKSEVLTELPPRTEIVIGVEPDAKERAFHEALRRDALAAIENESQPLARRRFQVLAQLMRLRRACCDPRLVARDSALAGAKIEAFAMIVEELVANKHKALVFSQFVDYLTLLRGELERMNVSYQYLDGSTPAAERARAVTAFQKGEGDMFLISLRAGGFGLNLTAADYVIIADPWWNPAVEDQAASRAHRMGQERPVTVYRLVVKGSVEERIMAMHQDKRALAEGLFTGEEFGGAVSVDELVRLMRDEG